MADTAAVIPRADLKVMRWRTTGRADVARLLDAYEELLGLAREVTWALNGTAGPVGLLAAEVALAKARAAGLLEAS